MSKFLTPPVWYDSKGNLVEILTGEVADYGATETERVTGSMAVGKGAYAGESYSVAVGNDATIYDSNTIAIGWHAGSSGNGNIVIGYLAHSEDFSDSESENSRSGSIVIGKNSTVYGDGSIAIGSGITLGTIKNPVSNIIQIGSSNVTYSAQIGDGNSTLECICSTAQTTGFTHTSWIQSKKADGTHPYPYAYLAPNTAATYQIALFDSADSKHCITSGIFYFEGSKADLTKVFAQTLDIDTNYNSSTETMFPQSACKIYISPPMPFAEDKRWTMYAAEEYGDGELKQKYLAFKYRRIE